MPIHSRNHGCQCRAAEDQEHPHMPVVGTNQEWENKCTVKSQPRNGTAQTLRDLHRHMNRPCTHTSTACASSLGDACCTQPSRTGDWPGRNKQPIVSAQATLSSQDTACTQKHGCVSLHKPWSHFTHNSPGTTVPWVRLQPSCPLPSPWAQKATPPEPTFSR